jgi:hypothetical protein
MRKLGKLAGFALASYTLYYLLATAQAFAIAATRS